MPGLRTQGSYVTEMENSLHRGSCVYQGRVLPYDVISQFPDENPGMRLSFMDCADASSGIDANRQGMKTCQTSASMAQAALPGILFRARPTMAARP